MNYFYELCAAIYQFIASIIDNQTDCYENKSYNAASGYIALSKQ